jgi:hypothetical protein
MQNFDAYNRDLTLDPADWAPLNTLAHQMVDDMLRFLAEVRDRPVWQKTLLSWGAD